ncbi:exodeoxyribonuclease III [Puniceicoccales bacterium CK1056]|uniref:Exodeoxyribonuclease III n=1 Tax=Oceanipulchritudo coccoides TaxID=2706888 RepID=A0A6B2M4H5_9BACT|nr:exodeoxyribonuclease III [Oceanipulchritudo coccoides]NDV63004.1 exodeoxyribonuclease III [Oceanipulchritudo coccoides]
MRIVSWNVNGLRAVLGKGLQDYLQTEQADVYCFQEIKANPEQVDWQVPDGYTAFWNPAQRKGYSGTMILSKSEPANYHAGIGEPEGDAEGRAQTLEFPSFHLVNVYTPNAKGDLSRLRFRTSVWDEAFREHCATLARTKPVVFCGDLNVAHKEIDLANPKSNRGSAGFTDEEREAFEKHLEAGFIDSFRHFNDQTGQYSWWSYRAGARARNVGWRIDYVCVSDMFKERMQSAFIRPEVTGSDHCPVGIDLEV